MGGGEWRRIFPQEQRAVYDAAGYGRKGGLGSQPALLVIDVTYGFVGVPGAPLMESIARYPNACGEAGWEAVAALERLLPVARQRQWPVFYTAGVTDSMAHHAGRWRDKHPKTLEQPQDANDIVDSIQPARGDIVIEKAKPSAFFGTPLASSLIDLRVDSVLIAGGTTSGCVRATAVDAFSYGFSVGVIEAAVFDRAELSHQVSLFELNQKYADVMALEDVLDLDPTSETGSAA